LLDVAIFLRPPVLPRSGESGSGKSFPAQACTYPYL
jgi:hypothetical protein